MPKLHPRVPPPFAGIQVNSCRQPSCPNFGVPPVSDWTTPDPHYKIVAHRRHVAAIECRVCHEIPALKSNYGVFIEAARMLGSVMPDTSRCCPGRGCANGAVPVGTKGAYQRWSFSPIKERWYCKACKKTFVISSAPKVWERDAKENALIFRTLVNGAAMRRAARIAEVGKSTIYDRLRVFDQRCTKFASARERTLLQKPLPAMRLQCDRQDFLMNWALKRDMRNIQLSAISSADSESGYIFGSTLNFDGTLDAVEINAEAKASGDLDLPYCHRRWSNVWLEQDYEDTVARKMTRRKAPIKERKLKAGEVLKVVADQYEETAKLDDTEEAIEHDEDSQLPVQGMQLHSTYVMYGHFMYIATLLGGAARIDYDLDQDSGLRAAYLSAFESRIKEGTSDGYYLYINKDLTNEEREAAVGKSYAEVTARQKAEPHKTRAEVRHDMLRAELKRVRTIGKWADRWVVHPCPSKNEAEKSMCCLTSDVYGRPPRDEIDIIEGYRRSSLDAVNRFHEQVRRGISLLERPIATASEQRRVWRGRSAYNPAIVTQMLNIFRVYTNFCLVGSDGMTAAMRLGLADRIYSEYDLIRGESDVADLALAA